MAVTDLTGTTWLLNSSLDLSIKTAYGINFVSNGSNYIYFAIGRSPNPREPIAYSLAYYTTYYNSRTVYSAYGGDWVDEVYRTIEITGGTDATNSTLIAWLQANAVQQVEPEPTGVKNILFGTHAIDKILFGQSEVSKIYLGQTLVWQAGSEPEPTVDPILNNNSWAVIAQVCNVGQAANYWALGDTKTDFDPYGITQRTFRICDMSGMYGKNAVFEQVGLEVGLTIQWNPSSNTDDNGCYNNYNISDMRSTTLPTLLANYSLELQAVITNTTYKVAKNGTQTTVLDLSDKLFLPAEREIFASRSRSVQDEWNALTRFALYALPENDNADFRKKYVPDYSTAYAYWERSPFSGDIGAVCVVNNNGENASGMFATFKLRVAPCFAIGVAPSGIAVRVTNNSSQTSPHIYDGPPSSSTKIDLGTLAPNETKTFYIENGYIYVESDSFGPWMFTGNATSMAISEPVSLYVSPYAGGGADN